MVTSPDFAIICFLINIMQRQEGNFYCLKISLKEEYHI